MTYEELLLNELNSRTHTTYWLYVIKSNTDPKWSYVASSGDIHARAKDIYEGKNAAFKKILDFSPLYWARAIAFATPHEARRARRVMLSLGLDVDEATLRAVAETYPYTPKENEVRILHEHRFPIDKK